MNDSEIFIVGVKGQLGRALQDKYPGAKSADIDELDITDQRSVEAFDWSGTQVIINAAAYTNVDGAETPEGSELAHKVNAEALNHLAVVAQRHNLVLVHISTDYVFDGSQSPHTESESFSPLSVYGTSKAEGDKIVATLPKHYIVRTSWVIGDGKNFVRTMLELGRSGVDPTVVNDQIGRLTFTTTLADAIDHLLTQHAPYGTYNVSNDGEPVSWAEIARTIFQLAKLPRSVIEISTAAYFKDKEGVAPRPLQSTLDLSKMKATGFQPTDWREELKRYVEKELET